MRFLYLAYDVPAYNAPGGADVVDNYTNSSTNPLSYNNPILVPVPNANPSTTNTVPQPGDIISFSANHTGVVMSKNVDSSGSGTLKVLEQNASSNGIAPIKVGSNANLPPWVLQPSVKNWLHHTVDLFPQSAPATTKVKVSGTGFGANEQVVITFDGETQVGKPTTNSMGTFSTTIAVPASAQPGLHIIQQTGQTSGFSPKTAFYVQTNWSTFGYNAQHTRFNPYETQLTSGNVSGLALDWNYTAGSYIYSSSPTVVNGIVYFGSWDKNIYAVDANTGALKWSYATGHFVYSSPAVVNGIVYVGSL